MNITQQIKNNNSSNIQQLAVFYTANDSIYAINISKVKAFIITEETQIDATPSDNEIITGIATIRGEPITLLNLDIWLGNEPLAINEYKLIVFCEFSNKQVGILVKDMLNIVEKSSYELKDTENQNSKVTYTTYVKAKEKDQLCTIFNAEQLLENIGWLNNSSSDAIMHNVSPLQSIKHILVADDSQFARDMSMKLLNKIDAQYSICKNGEELLNKLKSIEPDQVGLIITDIEMPKCDGYGVVEFVKNNPIYSHIPVVINSSMATDAVKDKMKKLGSNGFIAKPDLKSMYEMIIENIIG